MKYIPIITAICALFNAAVIIRNWGLRSRMVILALVNVVVAVLIALSV